jgi:hypothetical protein
MRSLPPAQRVVLVYPYLDDMPVAEIADRIRRSESATESLLAYSGWNAEVGTSGGIDAVINAIAAGAQLPGGGPAFTSYQNDRVLNEAMVQISEVARSSGDPGAYAPRRSRATAAARCRGAATRPRSRSCPWGGRASL